MRPMMRYVFHTGVLCLLLTGLYQFHAQAVQAAGADEAKIVFASTPWKTPEELQQYYAPLMDYLSRTLKKPVVFYVSKDYPELSKRLERKTADVGVFSPNAYVQAKYELPGLQYLVTALKKDETGEARPFYKGMIVTTKASGLQTLQELKGKKFGFTDYQSASGYLYPSALLKKNGIVAENYFSNVFMLKKHDKVTAALAHGTIEAGATWDGNLVAATQEHGDIFRVIASTPPIPLGAYAAASHVPAAEAKAIQKVLSELKPDSETMQKMNQAGFPFVGWSVLSDDFYNIVREVEGNLKE